MAISVGDRVLNFILKDQSGKEFRMEDNIGRGPLVIYFYPKDGTTGCTAEACSFRDRYEEFKDAGAEVVGISSDTETKHLLFVSQNSLPFTLLSDRGGKVRKLFGVPKTLGIIPGRVTYIIDTKGVVRYIFNSQSKINEHVIKALEMIENMR